MPASATSDRNQDFSAAFAAGIVVLLVASAFSALWFAVAAASSFAGVYSILAGL